MPLIIICGHPSSGKTYRSQQIVDYFERRIRGEEPDDDPANLSRATGALSSLNISSDRSNGTSVSGLTEAALARIDKPTAPANITTPSNPPTASSPAPAPSRQPQHTSTPRPTSSKRNLRIHHISDHTLSLPRSVYGSARAEKDARATLYSAVKRALGRDDIVVLDSGNYIKGWRYQLHCEAKNLGTPSCVVHVATTEEESRAINERRLAEAEGEVEGGGSMRGGDADADAMGDSSSSATPTPLPPSSSPDAPYDPQIHAELLARFEEPNGSTRWDSPLFTVPFTDVLPPLRSIWDEMVSPKDAAGARRVIRPNQATQMAPQSAPGMLYLLDRVTQGVLAKVQAWGVEHAGEGGGVVGVDLGELESAAAVAGGGGKGAAGGKKVEVRLPTNALSVPALQRMRRQFISMHRQQMGGMGMVSGSGEGKGQTSAERIGELFVNWLNDAFEQS